MTREKIAEIVNAAVADVFMLETAHVAAHPELNYRVDFSATSMQYFPLISTLEEELNIEIESHDFQNKASTVGDTIDLMVAMVGAN